MTSESPSSLVTNFMLTRSAVSQHQSQLEEGKDPHPPKQLPDLEMCNTKRSRRSKFIADKSSEKLICQQKLYLLNLVYPHPPKKKQNEGKLDKKIFDIDLFGGGGDWEQKFCTLLVGCCQRTAARKTLAPSQGAGS